MRGKYLSKRLFWTIIVILYVGFIFHNSFTPAVESSKQSGGVLEMVLQTASYLGIESGWVTEHLIRKTAHFAEYSLFGIQLFSEGRSGQISDVWLDISGVLTGFLMIGIWLWVRKKGKRVKKVR